MLAFWATLAALFVGKAGFTGGVGVDAWPGE
jgi:hypothetical protein